MEYLYYLAIAIIYAYIVLAIKDLFFTNHTGLGMPNIKLKQSFFTYEEPECSCIEGLGYTCDECKDKIIDENY